MAVGVVAGLLAVTFRIALHQIEQWRGEWVKAWLAVNGPGWAVMVVGAVVVVVGTARATRILAPAAAGSGIPHLKGVLMGVRILEPLRLVVVKFLGGCLAIGAGLSLGQEGPTVQMGGAVGQGGLWGR